MNRPPEPAKTGDTTPAAHFRTVVLGPGDFHFGQGRTRISTLLGSCVSITLWHPRRHIGGMCHYMLCQRPQTEGGQATLDGRYAAEAFELFLRHFERAGTRPAEYEAKLFGGANMFTYTDETPGIATDIGQNNVAYGRALLEQYGIALIAEHVGGNGRRKLHFDIWSGNVWLAFPEGEGAAVRATRSQHHG